MSRVPSAVETARSEILPLVEGLCRLAREEGNADQEAFFRGVRTGLELARQDEDLAGPFMELSSSAFLGFVFSPLVGLLLDQALEAAQILSTTLSAGGDGGH